MGCLLTDPFDGSYDANVHLNFADVSMDNSKFPSVIGVRIKASKRIHFEEEWSRQDRG